MFLSDSDFATVVRSTPLVSIDLIVENQAGQFLLGLRTNRPAKGYWFVPGGRVQKDETFDEAFNRLTKMELGQEFSLKEGEFDGVWQHFYEDNFDGHEFSTHYIVLSFKLQVDDSHLRLSSQQHSAYVWLMPEDLLTRDDVHENSRAYFKSYRQGARMIGLKSNGQDNE